MSRVDFVERGLLAGSDLRAALAATDDRGRRHIRATHRTFGVAIGLELRASSRAGTVTVLPGIAYDACGGTLLVTDATELLLPTEAPGPVTVALGPCGPRVLAAGETARSRCEVVLGRVDLGSGSEDELGRPYARSLAPPRIGSGTVARGAVAVIGTALAFSVVIDTSRAGFEQAPFYVVAPRGVPARSDLAGPLFDVHDATATQFTVAVRHVARTQAAAAALQAPPRNAGLPFTLTWLGVEPMPRSTIGAGP